MLEPRPASAIEAVARALKLLADPSNARNGYQLGTGAYAPVITSAGLRDLPWTQTTDSTGLVCVGCDCAGLICFAYKLPRHRPGFNVGSWSTVADDLNCDSMIQDSEHEKDCFVPVGGAPQAGDILVYPTITLPEHPGMKWIGHVCLVVGVGRASMWDPAKPAWDELDVVQVRGPNGRTPAAIRTDGSIWTQHDATWPRPEWRSRLLRVVGQQLS